MMASLGPALRGMAATLSRAGVSVMGAEVAVTSDALAAVTSFPTPLFVAPTATVAGKVELAKASSVWYSAVVVGEGDGVSIGQGASVGDGAVVKSGAKATAIGDGATV